MVSFLKGRRRTDDGVVAVDSSVSQERVIDLGVEVAPGGVLLVPDADEGRIEEADDRRQHMVDRFPVYSSQDIAKTILEWEYGIEIERTRLLMHAEEPLHAASSDTISSHRGTCPQGAGVSHGQDVIPASTASGGHLHV